MEKSEVNMRVLKTATCKTLSGKSTLTYQIGISPDAVVHLRISKNSGGGLLLYFYPFYSLGILALAGIAFIVSSICSLNICRNPAEP